MYPFNYLLPGWSTLAANFKVLNFSGLVQGNIYGKPWCLPFHVLLVNHPSTAIGGQFLSSHREIHHSSTSIGDGLLLALPHYTYSMCFLGGPSTWMGSSHEAFGICWIYLGLFRTSGFECARTSRAKRQTMHSCAVMHFMLIISHFFWDSYAAPEVIGSDHCDVRNILGTDSWTHQEGCRMASGWVKIATSPWAKELWLSWCRNQHSM
jgi:hypothetical protein